MYIIIDDTLEPEAGRRKDGSLMTLLAELAFNTSRGTIKYNNHLFHSKNYNNLTGDYETITQPNSSPPLPYSIPCQTPFLSIQSKPTLCILFYPPALHSPSLFHSAN